jgi:hypothetical protein
MSCARLVVLALALLALPGGALAQVTSSSGAIVGAVTDSSKGVLPGVTVTLKGGALAGTRDAVTDDQGRYQFGGLAPGTYTVTFELPGFSPLIREGINVRASFTATIDGELGVGSLQESVTVSGASPVIDTSSTAVANTFDTQTMKDLPTARDFAALMSVTPGVTMTRVDVGGSSAMSETGWTVYGMSGGGNQYTVEGIQVDSNYYNDFGSFQEVQIETAAHTAEMSVPGVMSTMIAKAGGNAYHGDFYTDYSRLGFSSQNIDDRQIGLGVSGGGGIDPRDTNRTEKYQDINGQLGGYIIKDKLWWAGSLRYNESLVGYPVFPVHPQLTRVDSRSAKVTYNLTTQNKIVGYYNYNFKYQPERFVVKTQVHPTSDETWDEDFPVGNYKLEYNSVLSSSLFFEARYGDFFYDFYNFDRAPERALYIDTATQTRVGGTGSNHRKLRTPQFNGAINYFKSGWGAVNHNFKFGWMAQNYTQQYRTTGRVSRDGDDLVTPDIQYNLINGAANQVVFNETPNEAKQNQWNVALYLNDAWQVSDKLTLNLGLRFDRYQAGYPDQVHEALRYNPATRTFDLTADAFPADSSRYSFNAIGPRVGVVYDLKGDGKTVIKGNYGSYPWRPSPRSGISGLNPNAETWSRTYGWVDTNGDLAWQPGEERNLVTQAGGLANTFIDPDWKLNVTKELATWVEREIITNFGIRTGLVWRWDDNPQMNYDTRRPLSAYNVPRDVRDPGADGVVGNADDGNMITVYDLDPAVLAATTPFNTSTSNSPKGIGSDHYTWEVSGVKRMANNWSMNASFSHTWSREAPNSGSPFGGVTGPTASAAYGSTANDYLGTDDGGRKNYTNWQGKIAATFMLWKDLKFSPVLRHQSGDPFGRVIVVRMNYGNQNVQVEPESANRVANVTLFDTRFEKGVTLKGLRLSGFFDVFNVFNTNAEQDINQTAGSTYLRPLNILSPRVARIGMKLEF